MTAGVSRLLDPARCPQSTRAAVAGRAERGRAELGRAEGTAVAQGCLTEVKPLAVAGRYIGFHGFAPCGTLASPGRVAAALAGLALAGLALAGLALAGLALAGRPGSRALPGCLADGGRAVCCFCCSVIIRGRALDGRRAASSFAQALAGRGVPLTWWLPLPPLRALSGRRERSHTADGAYSGAPIPRQQNCRSGRKMYYFLTASNHCPASIDLDQNEQICAERAHS